MKKQEANERYCSVKQSLIEACKQVNEIRAGKRKAVTWEEFYKSHQKEKKRNKTARIKQGSVQNRRFLVK